MGPRAIKGFVLIICTWDFCTFCISSQQCRRKLSRSEQSRLRLVGFRQDIPGRTCLLPALEEGQHTGWASYQKALPSVASVANSQSILSQSLIFSQGPNHRLRMTSPPTSPPSEGEIIESDSEKATTAITLDNDNSVDRPFRTRASVSRTPSPARSPRRRTSRTASRSPYRENRGAKRTYDDDHYDRTRNDPRHFKVRYEDRSLNHRSNSRTQFPGPDKGHGHEDRGGSGRRREKQPWMQDRALLGHGSHRLENESYGRDYGDRGPRDYWRRQSERGRYGRRGRLSPEQSVSDRGHSPVAAVKVKQEAEFRNNQTHPLGKSAGQRSDSAAGCVRSSLDSQVTHNLSHSYDISATVGAEESMHITPLPHLDEVAMIEERRKKREAIKAKHRGQATPTLVASLELDNDPVPSIPETKTRVEDTQPLGRLSYYLHEHTLSIIPASPQKSPRTSSDDPPGQVSPTDLVILRDADLANSTTAATGSMGEDEPSAADYDPTMDMQEDKIRHEQHRRNDATLSGAFNETAIGSQGVILPDLARCPPSGKNVEDGFDMFAETEELDMFTEVPAMLQKPREKASRIMSVPQAKALDMSMLDDWDDPEGYYKVILGELLDNRYHVQSNLGKGMFSGVVRATDQKTKTLVAIKLIRNNETM